MFYGVRDDHRDPSTGEKCFALKSLRWWCSEFENGRDNLNDNERARRPRLSVTDDNTTRVGAMVKAERRVRIKDIAQEHNISFVSAFNIILQPFFRFSYVIGSSLTSPSSRPCSKVDETGHMDVKYDCVNFIVLPHYVSRMRGRKVIGITRSLIW